MFLLLKARNIDPERINSKQSDVLGSTGNLDDVFALENNFFAVFSALTIASVLNEMREKLILVLAISKVVSVSHSPGVNLVGLVSILENGVGVVGLCSDEDRLAPDLILNVAFLELELVELLEDSRAVKVHHVLHLLQLLFLFVDRSLLALFCFILG